LATATAASIPGGIANSPCVYPERVPPVCRRTSARNSLACAGRPSHASSIAIAAAALCTRARSRFATSPSYRRTNAAGVSARSILGVTPCAAITYRSAGGMSSRNFRPSMSSYKIAPTAKMSIDGPLLPVACSGAM